MNLYILFPKNFIPHISLMSTEIEVWLKYLCVACLVSNLCNKGISNLQERVSELWPVEAYPWMDLGTINPFLFAFQLLWEKSPYCVKYYHIPKAAGSWSHRQKPLQTWAQNTLCSCNFSEVSVTWCKVS